MANGQIETIHLSASKWVWALVSTLLSLIVAGGIFWLSTVQADQQAVKNDVKKLQANNAVVGERIKGVETQVDAIVRSQARIERGIDKVTEKLDNVINRRMQ